jgi:Fe/S biogenesis protein NfuA
MACSIEAIDFVKITDLAQDHFRALLEKEDIQGMNLRIFVSQPGTEAADVAITFCPPGEQEPGDIPYLCEGFTIYIAADSKNALREAVIDYQSDAVGGQLSIKAPLMKGQAPSQDTPLAERIQYVIDSDINPSLAGHGGNITLIDILEDNIVILQFGGGCHGCGMANVTLKQGIEKRLKEKFPQILEIRDVTDHTTGTNPYF